MGKSTLVDALASALDARTVYEVFDENPFLARFYDERGRWAFPTEMFFLLSRYAQQETFAQTDLLHAHTVSDYLFDKCRLFAAETLTGDELALFDRTWDALARNVAVPDLVVYLHAPIDVLRARIRERGRSYESDIDPEYLAALDRRYRRFFADYDAAPVLRVDTTAVDLRQPEAFAALLDRVRAGVAGEIDAVGLGLT